MNAWVGEGLSEEVTLHQGLKDEGSAAPDPGERVLSGGNSLCHVWPLASACLPWSIPAAVSLFLCVISVILGIERQV